jgi:hypothetical protein
MGVAWAALMTGLLSLALGVAALAAVLVSLSTPDPFTPNGDPCCGRVRTLGELAPVMIGAPLLVGVAIALGILSRALWRDQWPGAARVGRSIGRWAGGLLALTGVLIGGNWLIERGSVLHAADCSTFRFTQAAWRSGDRAERVAAADGVARCGVARDRSRGEVMALLGRSARVDASTIVYDLDARTPGGEPLVLRLEVVGGHVAFGSVVPA